MLCDMLLPSKVNNIVLTAGFGTFTYSTRTRSGKNMMRQTSVCLKWEDSFYIILQIYFFNLQTESLSDFYEILN